MAVSVWLGGLDGAAWASVDDDRQHYAASTMKLPLVAAAFLLSERGELDLDATVEVHNRFWSALDGSPFSLEQDDDQDDETWDRVGSTCSLRRLAENAIVKSGNLATNLLLEAVGASAVAEVLAACHCSPRTTLPRGIGDTPAHEAALDNLVTAADLGRVMAAVGGRRLAASTTCEEVEDVLHRQEHRDKIPAGLPGDTYVANKTGWVRGIAHDVALVRPDDAPAYVLAVCTTTGVPEDRANHLIAEVSGAAWEARVR
jgi:beta-lactamase class A